MIQEEYVSEVYVSFETAKLLKEKGFDEENCYSYYGYINIDNPIQRPTKQMAMRWMREEHGILVWIKQPLEYGNCFSFHVLYNGIDKVVEEGFFNTYEEAVEAALKYCLTNLI